MKEREEAWQHIEDLAVQNPLFDKFSAETFSLYNSQSSILGSPQDDSDSDFNPDNIGGDTSEQVKKVRNKEKPLLRRKSELPHDQYTIKALSDHKRADDYLTTSQELTATTS
ncbi:Serine/threonine-protein phosphatase 2A 56 kDa regulatory subunit delta isoform [Halocaridina rubra]|uniref:Serine/threonine-protein phosphatase 2A 56 kDa regulatory subunit delta isoform n=1 Tax=Halocaridina rubra TaxID=373956 RepID=A0AAN9A861_HALRR